VPDKSQSDYAPPPFTPLPPQPMTHGNPARPDVATPQTTPSRQAEQQTAQKVAQTMSDAGITPDKH
jgi:hypothetical protein